MTRPIIDRPDLQSYQQKYGQGLLTVLFWVLFCFFMRPLVGMVGWVLGLELFADIMIEQGGYQALLELLGAYAGVIAGMGLALKGWALYNRYRYGRRERRLRHPNPIGIEAQAGHYQIEVEELRRLQAARRVVLTHDRHGRLVDCQA